MTTCQIVGEARPLRLALAVRGMARGSCTAMLSFAQGLLATDTDAAAVLELFATAAPDPDRLPLEAFNSLPRLESFEAGRTSFRLSHLEESLVASAPKAGKQPSSSSRGLESTANGFAYMGSEFFLDCDSLQREPEPRFTIV